MRKQRLVAAGITVLAASMALSACGIAGRDRRRGRKQQ